MTKHPLVAAAVLPHGDFVYDPSLIKTDVKAQAEARELHVAAQDVASTMLGLDLDFMLIITPHGLSAEEDIVAYLGHNGSGYAEIGKDVIDGSAQPYCVPLHDVTLADDKSKALWQDLRQQGCAITGLTSFGGYDDVPLRYGEVIPLSFFRPPSNGKAQHGDDNDNRTTKAVSCIIVSLPNRRYAHGSDMADEMVEFGSKLYRSLERIFPTKRVGIVVSADLAHTHATDGPYGFSPAAAPFDEACGAWANTLDETSLLCTARELLDEAKSCGYLGLAILHGVLIQERDSWSCRLQAISHPTYYGMMVARFLRA